jgi:hypothetical protein
MGLTMFESTTLLLLWIGTTYAVVQLIIGIMDAFSLVDTELKEKIYKRLDAIVHRVRVEKDNGTYYWYDNDSNTFLGQGSTDEEIINSLKSRFPDHIFYLPTNHFISSRTSWQPKLAVNDPQSLTDKSQ